MRLVEDDAIFQVDPRGPGGSEYVTVVWRGAAVNTAVMRWTAPSGSDHIGLIVCRCPLCDHPISLKPDVSASCKIARNRLTLRQIVQCNAHWPKTEGGVVLTDPKTGRAPRVVCGWRAIIIDGYAHDTDCKTATGHACTCPTSKKKKRDEQ